MAERRMFAKTIIDSDAFLDMSTSAQALYFHLGMRADDEGFVNNPKKIQRTTGASDDDLKILIAKKFIIPFESGIVVIKHWKIHNYIRGDRMQETKYHKEKRLLSLNENAAYTLTPVKISGNVTSESPQERTVRQMAYDKSSLPYSFDYKIRNAFYGKTCPVCGVTMAIDKAFGGRNSIPSIQHNVPVSKGGEHEIGNISVICKQCNVTLQDKETDSLNADEVAVVWDELSGKCQASDGQVSGECQHRLGKDSIGKDSVVKDSKSTARSDKIASAPEAIPVITLPLNDNSQFPITQAEVDRFSELYPAVDVPQALRAMAGWLEANPTKRKTRRGVMRFVNSWLSRDQDKGGTRGYSGSPASAQKPSVKYD